MRQPRGISRRHKGVMLQQASIFSTTVTRDETTVQLSLEGELDFATAPLLQRAVREVIGEHVHELVVDLAGLSFIDGAGLRGLADTQHAVMARSGQFRLQSVNRFTLRIIRLARLVELESSIVSAP